MTKRQVSILWTELKGELRRSLGPRGAAEWLALADQERLYADRVETNVIELKPVELTP